jgi:hypothetical protein
MMIITVVVVMPTSMAMTASAVMCPKHDEFPLTPYALLPLFPFFNLKVTPSRTLRS